MVKATNTSLFIYEDQGYLDELWTVKKDVKVLGTLEPITMVLIVLLDSELSVV